MIYFELPQKNPVLSNTYEKEYTSIITPYILSKAKDKFLRYCVVSLVGVVLVAWAVTRRK